MTFEEVLPILKEGKKIRFTEWGDNNVYVKLEKDYRYFPVPRGKIQKFINRKSYVFCPSSHEMLSDKWEVMD